MLNNHCMLFLWEKQNINCQLSVKNTCWQTSPYRGHFETRSIQVLCTQKLGPEQVFTEYK